MNLRTLTGWLTRPLLNRIKKLEGIHEGADCYIFGDGSSVGYFDLSSFDDKVGIAINAFPRHIDAAKTDIRYWIIAEAGFFLPPFFFRFKGMYRNDVSGFRNRVRFQSFFRRRLSDSRLTVITSVVNFSTTLHPKTHYFWDGLPKSKRSSGYSSRRESFAGSICAALTVAEYLGFRRAYLVGIDYTHNPGTSHHWYECVHPIESPQIPSTYHPDFFSEISEHMEIITVTPYAQQTELPSIDYETLTGKELARRRNTELLSMQDLQLLALNPRYQVLTENSPSIQHQQKV